MTCLIAIPVRTSPSHVQIGERERIHQLVGPNGWGDRCFLWRKTTKTQPNHQFKNPKLSPNKWRFLGEKYTIFSMFFTYQSFTVFVPVHAPGSPAALQTASTSAAATSAILTTTTTSTRLARSFREQARSPCLNRNSSLKRVVRLSS